MINVEMNSGEGIEYNRLQSFLDLIVETDKLSGPDIDYMKDIIKIYFEHYVILKNYEGYEDGPLKSMRYKHVDCIDLEHHQEMMSDSFNEGYEDGSEVESKYNDLKYKYDCLEKQLDLSKDVDYMRNLKKERKTFEDLLYDTKDELKRVRKNEKESIKKLQEYKEEVDKIMENRNKANNYLRKLKENNTSLAKQVEELEIDLHKAVCQQ